MALATVLLPAIIPALSDGIRGIVAKFTGGAGGQPQNVGERVQIMQAETERLKALAELDKPIGEISRWVADFRAVFRYAFIAAVWLATVAAIFYKVDALTVAAMLDLSGACGSFIIGERFYLKITGGNNAAMR